MVSYLLTLLAVLAIGTSPSLASAPPAPVPTEKRDEGLSSFPIVDLHAHVFFYEGMGIKLFGEFAGPIEASSWENMFFSRVNAQALETSGARVIVIALYAHPLFLGSERESIRRQIQAAQSFVGQHPNWIIARSALEATNAIKAGKRILVLSLEGASGVLENEEDLVEFVDHLGIRIVTPVHFVDDHFGGACLMPGLEMISNPIAALRSIFFPRRDRLGVRINSRGLEPDGRWLMQALIKRGVWIDLSHTSEATYLDMLPYLEQAKQPILYTHTVLREHFKAERASTPDRLRKVRDTQGLAGVLPSETLLGAMKAEPLYCPSVCGGSCHHGIPLFLTHYAEITALTGHDSSHVMIGSDINAPLTFLGPACDQDALAGDKGLTHYGELGELWKALRKFDLSPIDPNAWVNQFLATWSRVKSFP